MKTRTGQRVSKAMVEALATEAEAGYDARRLRPKRVGRPSLGRGVSPRVQVRFDLETHAQLRRAALAKKQTVSEYVRALVEARLAPRRKTRRKRTAL
jgi:hypothetical protein